ncbi:sushi, nidogen and EGF-like domain-containing protein 1 [Engystomops pustulosus]|uniref:sushi, nidogen and EGF-like domain-containing protein 1 n=1 Tax=Engystomops pustulosus TaxID=76066 RepID=UPI003AFB57FD
MTPAMINISSTSNVNFTGRWFFKVDKPINVSQNLLYPYGSALDALCPVSDDGSSPRIDLSVTLPLFGRNNSYLYVDNNGLLSFKDPISSWTPRPLPISLYNPFLAVFWADVDNTKAGNIYYRQSRDTGLLARATSDIRNYTQNQNFQAQWVFVATWDRVAYSGSTSNRVNTFQAVLITDGNSTYTLYNYADIQWTVGIEINGTPALAGYNNADGSSYYTIPGSMTPAMINISSTSNVNFTGRWFFKVDNPPNISQTMTTPSSIATGFFSTKPTTMVTPSTSNTTSQQSSSTASNITVSFNSTYPKNETSQNVTTTVEPHTSGQSTIQHSLLLVLLYSTYNILYDLYYLI